MPKPELPNGFAGRGDDQDADDHEGSIVQRWSKRAKRDEKRGRCRWRMHRVEGDFDRGAEGNCQHGGGDPRRRDGVELKDRGSASESEHEHAEVGGGQPDHMRYDHIIEAR